MDTIIIEDEKPAAEKLQKALLQLSDDVEVKAVLTSIEDSICWLQNNPGPDLVFMDIELTDGLSFRIFDQITLNCPVIFITAYDDYWQEAFEYNSIDYLLKPLKQEKLEAALKKYEKLRQHFSANFQQLQQWRTGHNGKYRKRFLVKKGIDYVTLKSDDIAYFYATHKLVCMVDNKAQKFILDRSLSEIEKEVDPAMFYRVNRKYLINMNCIRRIRSLPKTRLLLDIDPPVSEEIVISQENVMSFKEWMGQ
jgi:DNA-binding LytR/AlgR family response regulator